jgi:hypothetical protein
MESVVSGSLICALVASIADKSHEVEDILTAHNLQAPQPAAWYSLQSYLQVLQDISKKMGPHWLFNIGKNILAQATLPTHDLQEILQYIDALHQPDATGKNMYYKLLSYSEDQKEAHVECRNPFPCYFDRGILTSVFRNFQRNDVQSVHVTLDNHLPSRLAGAPVSYYTVLWQ